MFENMTPYIFEAILLVAVSWLLGLLLMWLIWRRKYRRSTDEWETKHNATLREFSELKTEHGQLQQTFKDTDLKLEDAQVKHKLALGKIQELEVSLETHREELLMQQEEVRMAEKIANESHSFRKKYEKIFPEWEIQDQKIQDLQAKILQMEDQKKELNDLIQGLRPYRTRYEALDIQYRQLAKELDALQSESEQVASEGEATSPEESQEPIALVSPQPESPKAPAPDPTLLEMQGKLRWAEHDKLNLAKEIKSLKESLEKYAQEQVDLFAALSRKEWEWKLSQNEPAKEYSHHQDTHFPEFSENPSDQDPSEEGASKMASLPKSEAELIRLRYERQKKHLNGGNYPHRVSKEVTEG